MHRSLCIIFVLLCVRPRSVDGFIAAPVSRVSCAARNGNNCIFKLPETSKVRVHDQQRVGRTTTVVMGIRRGVSRSDALKIVGVAIAGTVGMSIAPSNAAAAARTTEELVQLVRDAKRQLDPVDGLISEAKWDAIRSIIKTKPLADVKNIIAELARQADEDDSPLLLGMRQDVLDHVQYLDSFSYNNVFIGEERQILGTKIDFDTPRMELRQCREAFDLILEVLPSTE